MKTLPLSCFVAFCGLVVVCHARSPNWYTTGDFYERLTSYLADGLKTLSDADTTCQNNGKVLPTVTSQKQLSHLMRELTELYWDGTKLKDCLVNDVEIWINHKVNVQGDTPPLYFKDIDDANGQYCAVLATIKGFAADLQGTFQLQGRDCSSQASAVCVRTGMFREAVTGSDEGGYQIVGDHDAVKTLCQDFGMQFLEIDSDSDEDDLEAEINRLGFPRYLKESLRALNLGTSFVFHVKNKVGGNPGDVLTFSELTPGDNCLIVKNRAGPDIELYDLVVDDCTTHGRGLCTTTDPGRFYNKLEVVDLGEGVFKSVAAEKCAAIGKELPSLHVPQDLFEISRELVRLGVFNFITGKNFRNGIWVKNTTTAGTATETFADIVPEDPTSANCLGLQNSEVMAGEIYILKPVICEVNHKFLTVCVDAA